MSPPPKALVVSTLLVLVAACGDGATGPDDTPETVSGPLADLTPDQQQAVRLAAVTLAVATAGEGHSFLDNFLPCPQRGVINYHNTPAGRHATFSGCDLGGDITVEGSGEVRWVGPDLAQSRQTFCRFGQTSTCERAFAWSGELTVTRGTSSVTVTAFRVDSIVWGAGGGTFPAALDIGTAELGLRGFDVALGDTTLRLRDDDLPGQVFDISGTDINAIPNPSGEPSALTEADVKRLVYHGSVGLLWFLVDETLEIQRGTHTHELECGTSVVTPDLVTQTTQIDNTWTACPFYFGLFMSGTFRIEWGEVDFDNGPLTMVVSGTLTVGGAIPTTTIQWLEWTAAGVGGPLALPGTIRISGTIDGPTQQRAFSFEVAVDD